MSSVKIAGTEVAEDVPPETADEETPPDVAVDDVPPDATDEDVVAAGASSSPQPAKPSMPASKTAMMANTRIPYFMM